MSILKIFSIFSIALFTNAIFAQSKVPDTLNVDDVVFTKTEEEAFYPGGIPAWSSYLQKALGKFNPADNGAPVGKYQVIIRFIISRNGAISDITPETKFGYEMEEKVIAALKYSGKWAPAVQNGRPVNAYRRQPVTFIVESEDFEIIMETPNTLYANSANHITVKAKGVKPENIGINVTGGKVTANNYDGTFTIMTNKSGRVIIEVVNTKKNDKVIGTASIAAITKN